MSGSDTYSHKETDSATYAHEVFGLDANYHEGNVPDTSSPDVPGTGACARGEQVPTPTDLRGPVRKTTATETHWDTYTFEVSNPDAYSHERTGADT